MKEFAIASIRSPAFQRDELGSLDGLVESIRKLGLLQPIIISPDRTLLAGRRRLEACRRLGWRFIPAITIGADALEVFAHENYHREPLLAEQVECIKAALAARQAPAPKPRKRAAKAQGVRHD